MTCCGDWESSTAGRADNDARDPLAPECGDFMPISRREAKRLIADVLAPVTSDIYRRITAGEKKLTRLEHRMTTAEQDQYARGIQLVGLLKAEFASLHAQLDAAIEDKDAAIAAGVESALGQDSAADAERIKGLLDELATVLPGDVPDVPVPDPGQPAELPVDEA